MKIIEESKAEITIRRPNGTIEVVCNPEITYITDQLFSRIKKANQDAGRGECLSYRNVDAITEIEDSDYLTICERCGKQIDKRSSYRQPEWINFGGKKVRVVAHYCDSCKQLLQSIGVGEYTDLKARANTISNYEPYTKKD